jgi:hypothetical protein
VHALALAFAYAHLAFASSWPQLDAECGAANTIPQLTKVARKKFNGENPESGAFGMDCAPQQFTQTALHTHSMDCAPPR